MKTDTMPEIDQWVRQWTPFIRRHARTLGLWQSDEDDWVQVARLAFWQVSGQFNSSSGRSFDSFILDAVKCRLIDLKRKEMTLKRSWLHGVVCINETITAGGVDMHDVVGELLAVCTTESATVLRLIYEGHSVNELRIRLGIPRTMIARAKDELAAVMVEGGSMELRGYLVERCKELGLPHDDAEGNYNLANRILSHNRTRVRRMRVVAAPIDATSVAEPTATEPPCGKRGCERPVNVGHAFCSLSCSESAYRELNIAKKGRDHVLRPIPEPVPPLRTRTFYGEASEEGIKALENEFKRDTVIHETFELLRRGGTSEDLIYKLTEVVQAKQLKCSSPSQRLRRVVTDVRKAGYELHKSIDGVFRLTGRKR